MVGWLFREISGPYLLFHALKNPKITWRTRIYKLAWGGIAYELPSTPTTIQKRKSSFFIKSSLPDSVDGIEMQVASDIVLHMDEDGHNDQQQLHYHYQQRHLHDNNIITDHRDHYQKSGNVRNIGEGGDIGYTYANNNTHVPAPSNNKGALINGNNYGGGNLGSGVRNLQSLQLHPQYQSSSPSTTDSGNNNYFLSRTNSTNPRGHSRSISNGNFGSYSNNNNSYGPVSLNRSSSSCNYNQQSLEMAVSSLAKTTQQHSQQQQQNIESIIRLHTANNNSHQHHHTGHKKSSSLTTSSPSFSSPSSS